MLLTASLPALAGSGPPPKSFDEAGAGVISCVKFNHDVNDRNIGAIAGTSYFSWAQGFLTATNLFRASNGTDTLNLAGWGVEAQMNRMKSYCRAHPTDKFLDAVTDLLDALPPIPGSGAKFQEQQQQSEDGEQKF